MLQATLIGVAVLSFFGFLRIIGRQSDWQVARTGAHVFSCLAATALPFLVDSHLAAGLLCGILCLVIILETYRLHWFPFLNLRRGSLHLAAATCFLSWFGFHQPILFSLSFLVLGLADPCARTIGRNFGKPQSLFQKSWHGTVAHALVCMAILLPFFLFLDFSMGQALGTATFTAIVVSLVEAISNRGWDNFTVPVACYGLLTWMVGL